VLGVSGRAMLAALVAGERDPEVLAELARGRLRTKLPQLRQALRGRFSDHHALLVGLSLAHLEHLEGAIAALDTEVDQVISPFARARDQLDTITGVGKRPRRRSSPRSASTWRCSPPPGTWRRGRAAARATTAPGASAAPAGPPRATAGWGRCSPGCAWAAARSRDTYLAAQYWRLARRIGKKKAAMAVGHSILVIAWHLLANNCDYADLGGDFFLRRDTDRARQRAVAQLQALGYQVTLQTTAA
jgi:transposase